MLAACPYPTAQGTQALIGELATGCARLGHEIHLVAYGHSSLQRKEPFAIHRTPNIPGYHRVRSGPDMAKPFLDTMMVRTALRVVQKHRCQVIHAHNYEGALAGWFVSRLSGVPLLYHGHNWMADELPSYFQFRPLARASKTAGAILDRTIPRLAHRVIALHQTMAQHLEDFGVPHQKIQVVAPGIDPEPWTGTEPATRKDIVLYAGNLDSYQNLQLAFHAMALVTKKVPTARLVMATPNDPALARQMASEHRANAWCEVVHARDAAATAREYARAKVAVCPRTSPSGFPVKILNAMAAGVPVVACRSGAMGLESGAGVETVDDDDHESMARSIVELLINGSHRSMLADEGRALVATLYNREEMCRKVVKIWTSML